MLIDTEQYIQLNLYLGSYYIQYSSYHHDKYNKKFYENLTVATTSSSTNYYIAVAVILPATYKYIAQVFNLNILRRNQLIKCG